MASETQFAANRANSQHSTGPTSAAGKARAASNGLTHGLNASPEILFEAKPEEAESYRTLALKLRRDCQPDSGLEDETFQRYAWSTFQATRARRLEIHTEDRWLEDPDDAKRFSQMERTIKLAAAQERRADKALRELRQLQKDRFAAYEVYAEHCVMGKEVNIPKSLPVSEIRKSDLSKTNPNYLAQFLLYQTDDVKMTAKQMLKDAKTKANQPQPSAPQTNSQSEANPFASMSLDALLKIAKDAGL